MRPPSIPYGEYHDVVKVLLEYEPNDWFITFWVRGDGQGFDVKHMKWIGEYRVFDDVPEGSLPWIEWVRDTNGMRIATLHLRPVDIYGVGGSAASPARSVLDGDVVVGYGLKP